MSEQRFQVIPIDDLREHIAIKDCWCHPTLDEDGVYVHHPMDNREEYVAAQPGMLRLQ